MARATWGGSANEMHAVSWGKKGKHQFYPAPIGRAFHVSNDQVAPTIAFFTDQGAGFTCS